jgi:hypothetical protein
MLTIQERNDKKIVVKNVFGLSIHGPAKMNVKKKLNCSMNASGNSKSQGEYK